VTELRVVHGGEPTDAELAAVVAVLTARARAAMAEAAAPLRPALAPWVASGLVKGTRTLA
jgi:Acyl-CoA carboxylase epsilon subunit